MDANSKRYHVGQVLYIVPKNDNKVIPVLVVEEITKKTLKGSEVTYRIQSTSDTAKIYLIDDVSGTFFVSPEAAKKSLIEIASARITKIVDHAARKAREWYGSGNDVTAAPADPLISLSADDMEDMGMRQEDAPDAVARVQLDDGTVANVKISPPKL